MHHQRNLDKNNGIVACILTEVKAMNDFKLK